MTRWTADDLKRVQKVTPRSPTDRIERPRSDSTEPGGVRVLPRTPTASKYRNKRAGKYASQKEAKRAAELRLLEKSGAIRNLREQVAFELIPSQEGERSISYWADFCYEEPVEAILPSGKPITLDSWRKVVEDCKGMKTPAYILKRKLMLWVHKIRIRET